jgi:hypothetical protein
MSNKSTEFTVGIFMIVGILALVYLSVSIVNIELFGS